MADNIVVKEAATGKTFKTLEVGGIHIQVIKLDTATTATLANVSAAVSSTTLIASNTSRKGAVIYNDSSSQLFLKFGSSASDSSFTYKVLPFSHWTMDAIVYTGIITGAWESATGTARTTEL